MGLKYCISRQKISFWNISWKWQVCYHPRKKLSSSCEKDNPQENNTYNLTLSWRRPLSYRNQSIDLLCKSMGWFLYDNGLRYERVKEWYLSCLKEHVGNIVWDRDCINKSRLGQLQVIPLIFFYIPLKSCFNLLRML